MIRVRLRHVRRWRGVARDEWVYYEMKTKPLTPKEYATQAHKLSGSLDANRWALAELAAEAKFDGVNNYARIMAEVVGRSDKTIYEWIAILMFQKTLPRKRCIKFGHYSVLYRVSDRLSSDKILDLIDHAAEHNISQESLREMVADELQGDDVNPIRDARHRLNSVVMKLSSIGRIAGLPMVFYHAISAAQEALQMIKSLQGETETEKI